MTNSNKNDNTTVLLIFELFEIINRCIDMNIDNPSVKLVLDIDFKELVGKSRKLSIKHRKQIESNSQFINPGEVFDQQVDNLYKLILESHGLVKNWQFKKAIKEIKKIVG